jgi:hypothetical protein
MSDFQKYINGVSREMAAKDEEMLYSAFMQVFGFPIDTVKDTENFERVVDAGGGVESFRYDGHLFLTRWQRYNNDGENYKIIVTYKIPTDRVELWKEGKR